MTPLRILIAEDDPVQSEVLDKMIRLLIAPLISTEVEVTIVTTLREVEEQSQFHNATLLDLTLDDAGEAETVPAIRRCRHPVIVMTGHYDETLHALCRTMGADIVFVKGQVPEKELCRAIVEAFSKDLVMEGELAHHAAA